LSPYEQTVERFNNNDAGERRWYREIWVYGLNWCKYVLKKVEPTTRRVLR